MNVVRYSPLVVEELLEIEIDVSGERPADSAVVFIVRSETGETVGVEFPQASWQRILDTIQTATARLPGGTWKQ